MTTAALIAEAPVRATEPLAGVARHDDGDPLRILIYESSNGFGGAVLSARENIRLISEATGWQFTLVHSLDSPRIAEFDAVCAKRIHKDESSWLHSRLARRLNLSIVHDTGYFVGLIREHNIDLVYANNSVENAAALALAARLMGVPVVVHERDIPGRLSRTTVAAMPLMDAVIAVSDATRQALVAEGLPRGQVILIHNGINTARFRRTGTAGLADVRQSLGAGPDSFLVVICGMLTRWKGQDVVIEATRLARAAGLPVHLAIVGEAPTGDHFEAELRANVAGDGLADAVTFAGFRADIPAIMQAADVVVHASRNPEPFGRVVIEAMAAGTPVIATDTGGPVEIIDSGITGVLVPPDDAPALFKALEWVWTARADVAAMVRQAEARAVERYDSSRPAAKIINEIRYLQRTGGLVRSPDITQLPPFADRTPVDASRIAEPRLLVLVDVEEEFDWTAPFPAKMPPFSCIDGLEWLVDSLAPRGLKPCLLLDYCALLDERSVERLRAWASAGLIEVGAQLHTWVTPPYEEAICLRNSFQCNLPADLQRRKIAVLTEAIEKTVGVRPHVFRAGRYGLGANTPAMLAELGYKVDLSACPISDYSSEHGPNYSKLGDEPFWFGSGIDILEIPLMRMAVGLIAALSRGRTPHYFASAAVRTMRLPGAMARARLFERLTLSPEGQDVASMARLLDYASRHQRKIFSLSLHSSSFVRGGTPYVETDADVEEIKQRILAVADMAIGRFGALPDTPLGVRALVEPFRT